MSDKDQIKAIQDIRKMMNRSIRFLSLSGLSGVFAGCYALIASFIAYRYMQRSLVSESYSNDDLGFFFMLGSVTLFLSILTSFFLTSRKAKREGTKLWDASSQNALTSFLIPLISGAIFCLSLIKMGVVSLIAPVMLLFYGLSLVSASRYTLPTTKQLGILQIILGLMNAFYLGYGLIFWSIGFGVLHIVYGVYMFIKYDRA